MQNVDAASVLPGKNPDPGAQFGGTMLLGRRTSPSDYISYLIRSRKKEILKWQPNKMAAYVLSFIMF